MNSSIFLKETGNQYFIYNNETLEIISPSIGCIIYRLDKNTKTTKKFVVVNIYKRTTGQNKGIIDKIKLYPVNSIDGKKINYENVNYPIIFMLTNHGFWWRKELLKNYEFSWNKQSPRRTRSPSIPIIRDKIPSPNNWTGSLSPSSSSFPPFSSKLDRF
uniref:Uncharacterized protein n=1 Tax=Pithovirus LCPAC104 TaxID=2506589 RepID=A0A481Z517_9VIRU|nr:MAG: hypothetical protein LCPAC104_01950 [Pithovirus LCPAC104]